MKNKKLSLIAGIIKDPTLIGIGWTKESSTLIICLLSLYIGIKCKRKFNRLKK